MPTKERYVVTLRAVELRKVVRNKEILVERIQMLNRSNPTFRKDLSEVNALSLAFAFWVQNYPHGYDFSGFMDEIQLSMKQAAERNGLKYEEQECPRQPVWI